MDSDFGRRRPAKPAANRRSANTENTSFQTPEQAAADDADIVIDEDGQEVGQDTDSMGVQQTPSPEKKPLPGWRTKLGLHWPPNKRTAAVIIVALLLIAGGAYAIIANANSHGAVIPALKPVPKKVSDTVPSTLTGMPVDPSVNKRPVTAVMIENSLDARPQAGLGQAGVVFEAIAEAGITRFLALYQDTAPSNVGPVRSARPYYVQWALGFDAAYAHVGGSPDALNDIKSWNVRDMNQFYNGNYYHRVTTRAAPHNVYTSLDSLTQLEDSKGYTSSTFTGFPRKKDAPSKKPTAASINFAISSASYNVHYDYNAAQNDYLRSEGGQPHIDANTNTQISPKVVIAMVIPYSLGALDASGAYYSQYAVIGSGQAYIFQDGTVSTGTWNKASNTTQITFSDANGKTIKLNAGQTWLTALGNASYVSYTP